MVFFADMTQKSEDDWITFGIFYYLCGIKKRRLPIYYKTMKLNLHLTNKLVTPEEEDEQRYPWAYNKKTKWNDRMKKRAIIWLSQRVGKPVLKLTALDYEKNNLRELLDEYGKAEFANLFIFSLNSGHDTNIASSLSKSAA